MMLECRSSSLTLFLSLGIDLGKIMVLQYSNQETAVTIGESVRDEDGISYAICTLVASANGTQFSSFRLRPPVISTTI